MTKRHDLIPYHCCFLLERQSTNLSMAIAWRRVGSNDYGVYLTRRGQESDSSPLCTVFKAVYGQRGEIVSFLVADGWPRADGSWHEDHVDYDNLQLSFASVDEENLSLLANAFFGEWLESFGEADAVALLKSVGLGARGAESPWRGILESGLPAAIRKNRLLDVLGCVQSTEHGHLYCFMPFPERPGAGDASATLLEAKMRMFFELL